MLRRTMLIRAGTSGYSYSEWKGPFYPPAIKPAEMLAHFAQRLPTVEINNTFYRMPKRDVVANWARQVPPEFRFAIKASRRITHFRPLQDAAEPLTFLLATLEPLGERLGCVLFQLPPTFRADHALLAEFLDRLPGTLRCAFEFRHPSWFEPATFDALRAANAALVIADGDQAPADTLEATADWGYLRLRRSAYSDADLGQWRKRIADQAWERAFVYFKHEDEAAGPRMAARFMAPG